jgi:hypothetical protein
VEVHSANFGFVTEQQIVLPLLDSKGNTIIILVDTSQQFHIFPQTAEAFDLVISQASSLFFYIANTTQGRIEGFTLGEQVTGRRNVVHNLSDA